jgi:hypothetical protein
MLTSPLLKLREEGGRKSGNGLYMEAKPLKLGVKA